MKKLRQKGPCEIQSNDDRAVFYIFLYFLYIDLIHYEQKSLYRKCIILSGSFDIDVDFYFDQISQRPYQDLKEGQFQNLDKNPSSCFLSSFFSFYVMYAAHKGI